MSLHKEARDLIDQAGTAIQAGNQQYAIELLRQSILYNGKDAEAYILLGIALAQSKMPADAENAFLKATRLAPDNVKARYNLAVHQYAEGQLHSALASARQAAQIDVLHAGSKDLVARIEKELGLQPGEEPVRTPAGNVVPLQMRPGYEEQAVQTMPFVERMGAMWTFFGIVIALSSFVGLLVMISISLPHLNQNLQADALIKTLSEDPKFKISQGLGLSSLILGIIWTAMDVINRRANLLWLLPQVACGCVGFTWLILPIYMKIGRNN